MNDSAWFERQVAEEAEKRRRELRRGSLSWSLGVLIAGALALALLAGCASEPTDCEINLSVASHYTMLEKMGAALTDEERFIRGRAMQYMADHSCGLPEQTSSIGQNYDLFYAACECV